MTQYKVNAFHSFSKKKKKNHNEVEVFRNELFKILKEKEYSCL